VIGGGISGLALVHALKSSPLRHLIQCTLVERSHRLGGWIHTTKPENFLMESGPRSLITRRGEQTMALVQELGLVDQVVTADANAAKRYIWMDGALHMLPTGLAGIRGCRPMEGVLAAAWKECFTAKGDLADESVYSFIERRFDSNVADNLIDPMVAGIYSGDPKKLSVKSCFPFLRDLEVEHGSVVRGMLLGKKKKEVGGAMARRLKGSAGIYSFKDGMETLPRALEHFARGKGADIRLETDIQRLSFDEGRVTADMHSEQQGASTEHFDYVVSTINATSLSHLLAGPGSASASASDNALDDNKDEVDDKLSNASNAARAELVSTLAGIEDASVYTVNVGYDASVLERYPGFGFLVPSSQQDASVLGVTFDSHSFPSQNAREHETRLTVMMGGARRPELLQLSAAEAEALALQHLEQCLGITATPATVTTTAAHACIPQYHVGHSRVVERTEELAAQLGRGRLSLLGSSFYGVSVNDCIRHARTLARTLTSPPLSLW